jgi:hypothetical protein
MKIESVKAEFSNLEIHIGEFRDSKFKLKGDVSYEDLMLIITGDKRTVRVHARNLNNVHLEKKALRIAAVNFEIKEGEEVSVATGSIRLELGDESEAWYKELWG